MPTFLTPNSGACATKYLGHPVLVQWANQAAGKGDVRFFAVSALGQAAKFGRVAKHGIVPYRCLDPWKWFLANGVDLYDYHLSHVSCRG